MSIEYHVAIDRTRSSAAAFPEGGVDASAKCVFVDHDHIFDRILIATRQVPDDGKVQCRRRVENLAVALAQLLSGQPSSERVTNVRISSRLVQQEVAVSEPRDNSRQEFRNLRGCGDNLARRRYR